MPKVFVGETRLPKNFKRYARQYSLLELDCEPGSIPGKARLEACAEAAPDGFVFSLVVPSLLASLRVGAESDKAWKLAAASARVLQAKWWVVRTPAEVRPTRRTRDELGSLFTRLKESGMRVAWEPRGVWDEDAAAETADALGVHLVQDLAREEPLRSHELLYTRLLALGKGARVGLSLADLVVERVRSFEEAFVVVEGQGAREIQQALGLASVDDDSAPESVEIEES
jgi:uncharacterized protein YecE (DUF72 family)